MRMKKYIKFKAFTLIELLIALVVSSILGLISYSSLVSLKIGYRRKEAHAELMKLKVLIQENAIKNDSTVVDVAKSIATPIYTANNYYKINIEVKADNTIVLSASPAANSPQEKDSVCNVIILTTNIAGSGMSNEEFTSVGTTTNDPKCWQ